MRTKKKGRNDSPHCLLSIDENSHCALEVRLQMFETVILNTVKIQYLKPYLLPLELSSY